MSNTPKVGPDSNNTIVDQQAASQAPDSTQNTAEQQRSPEAVSSTNSHVLYMSNWTETLQFLQREKANGDSRFLIEHLSSDPTTLDPRVKLGFVLAMKRAEFTNSDPRFLQRMQELESYFQRQILFSNQNPNLPLSALPNTKNLDTDFNHLFNQLKERNIQLTDTRQNFSTLGVVDSARNAAGTGVSFLAETFGRLNNLQKGAVVVLGIFALYKAVNSARIRGMLYGTAMTGGLIWLSNGILKAASGRSALEWVNRAIGTTRSRELREYFNINDENKNQVDAFSLLMESVVEDHPFGINNSFKSLVAAHSASRDGRMPDSIVRNQRFSSVTSAEETPLVLHRSVGIIVDKFGPRSNNYQTNPNIRSIWDRLMAGDINWRQGVLDLIAADENAPKDLLPTIPEAIGYSAAAAYETASRTVVSFSDAAIRAIPDSWGEKYNEYKDKAKEFFSELIINRESQSNSNIFNQRLNNIQDIANFEHQVGTLSLRALNSTNNVYRDASTVIYGTYQRNLDAAEFDSSAARLEFISTQMRAFIDQVQTMEINGVAPKGSIEFLYGAEVANGSNGGNYYVSFAFIPENLPTQSLVGPSLYDTNLNTGTPYDFRLNGYEQEYFREFYQLNSDEFVQRALRIARTKVPQGTPASEIPLYLFTEESRTEIQRELGITFDTARWDYFQDLLEINEQLSGGDRVKYLSMNTFAVMAPRKDTEYMRSLGFSTTYGTPEFVAQYRQYMTQYLT